MNRTRTQSAGTSEIARSSGGESLRVDDASALETTFTRLRQRYALHFNLAEGVKPGQERDIHVDLSPSARRRYPDAQVRFHRVNLSDASVAPVLSSTEESIVVSQAPTSAPPTSASPPSAPRRRPAVNEDGTRSDGGWRRSDEPAPAAPAVDPQLKSAEEQPKPGGWRRVKPGETP